MKIPAHIHKTLLNALLSELGECRASSRRAQKSRIMPRSFKHSLRKAWAQDYQDTKKALAWLEEQDIDTSPRIATPAPSMHAQEAKNAQEALHSTMAATGLGGDF